MNLRRPITCHRVFNMPSATTFAIPAIGDFVRSYLKKAKSSVDPFARNCNWATYTNDIDPRTSAQSHMDAVDFLNDLHKRNVTVSLAFFDPPYSPSQYAEHYRSIEKKVSLEDYQDGRIRRRVRDAIDRIMEPQGIVLSFGWQSMGMGIKRNYTPIEILLVTHGGAHNDTICLAERKNQSLQFSMSL